MAYAYLNNGAIELPNLKAQSIDHEIIADEARTADGTLRRDVLATKRVWKLDLVFLTKAQYDAIMNHLASAGWGMVRFWIDELGGTAAANSINAYVSVAKDERVQFRNASGWQQDGRHLSLVITEK